MISLMYRPSGCGCPNVSSTQVPSAQERVTRSCFWPDSRVLTRIVLLGLSGVKDDALASKVSENRYRTTRLRVQSGGQRPRRHPPGVATSVYFLTTMHPRQPPSLRLPPMRARCPAWRARSRAATRSAAPRRAVRSVVRGLKNQPHQRDPTARADAHRAPQPVSNRHRRGGPGSAPRPQQTADADRPGKMHRR